MHEINTTLLSGGIDPFGKISAPEGVSRFAGGTEDGLPILIQNLFRLMIVGAGLYAVLNFILAGYDFLGAGDDPQKVQMAWQRIYNSIIGLVVAAGAFAIAAIIGMVLYGQASGLLQFKIFTP